MYIVVSAVARLKQCPLFMCKLMSMHAIENRQLLDKNNNTMAAVSSLLQHMACTHIPDSAVVDLLMLLTKGHILAYGIAAGASFIVVGKHVDGIGHKRYCCIIQYIDEAGTTCIAHAGTCNSTLQIIFWVGTTPHRARAWHEFYHAPNEKNIVQACLGISDSE